jgi:drug/metabolite transporter (DMT)-like permease
MYLLLLVSLIWAFSFGLIKVRFAGVDPTAVTSIRLAFAFLLFAPFYRRQGLAPSVLVRFALIGAVQFGVMYLFYQGSFAYLKSHEVALFTLLTPLYLALIDAVLERQWQFRHAVSAALAVAGSGIVLWRSAPTHAPVLGFLFVQISNVCFAAGQLAWRRERARLEPTLRDGSIFALPFAGALAASLIVSAFATDWTAIHLSAAQWGALAYLGLLSSGACFFWWNLGATRVNTGTLGVFNNAKVPLAVACSLLFFGESADWRRLIAGGGLMVVGVLVSQRGRAATPPLNS